MKERIEKKEAPKKTVAERKRDRIRKKLNFQASRKLMEEKDELPILTQKEWERMNAVQEVIDKIAGDANDKAEDAFEDPVLPTDVGNRSRRDAGILSIKGTGMLEIGNDTVAWQKESMDLINTMPPSDELEEELRKVEKKYTDKIQYTAEEIDRFSRNIRGNRDRFAKDEILQMEKETGILQEVMGQDSKFKRLMSWAMGYTEGGESLDSSKDEMFAILKEKIQTEPGKLKYLWFIASKLDPKYKKDFKNNELPAVEGILDKYLREDREFAAVLSMELKGKESIMDARIAENKKQKYKDQYKDLHDYNDAADRAFSENLGSKNKMLEWGTMGKAAGLGALLFSGATVAANVGVGLAQGRWKKAESWGALATNPMFLGGAVGTYASYRVLSDGFEGIREDMLSAEETASEVYTRARSEVHDIYYSDSPMSTIINKSEASLYALGDYAAHLYREVEGDVKEISDASLSKTGLMDHIDAMIAKGGEYTDDLIAFKDKLANTDISETDMAKFLKSLIPLEIAASTPGKARELFNNIVEAV